MIWQWQPDWRSSECGGVQSVDVRPQTGDRLTWVFVASYCVRAFVYAGSTHTHTHRGRQRETGRQRDRASSSLVASGTRVCEMTIHRGESWGRWFVFGGVWQAGNESRGNTVWDISVQWGSLRRFAFSEEVNTQWGSHSSTAAGKHGVVVMGFSFMSVVQFVA